MSVFTRRAVVATASNSLKGKHVEVSAEAKVGRRQHYYSGYLDTLTSLKNSTFSVIG